jgi:RHS repeat-associated protein
VTTGTTTSVNGEAGQRTQQPNGVKTYYPFPGYEEEVNGSTTTRRTTYSLGGQAVAVRVQVVGGSNTVYYLHSDHLGSTTALSSSAVGGGLVSGSTARYLPFGAWRTTPTQTLTDRGYTGHLENMEIGLVYMNARYFVPAIGRFASADTVVPGLDNPQAWNRYAYVANNPLILTDPSGHCWGFASGLRNTFLSTTCSNLDMAATIVASPDATVAQRAFAGGYIVAEAAAGTMLTVGSAVLVAEAAPVAAGYAGTAVMQAQATAAAHPVAAGVVGGVLETAAECTMTGGGCGADAYLMGALTGGMSSASASTKIYRSATGTPDSMTPRPGVDDVPGGGLSFYDNVDNVGIKPGKYVEVDTSFLRSLHASRDNTPPGHITVRPNSLSELREWAATRNTGAVHPYTQELLDAITYIGIKR